MSSLSSSIGQSSGLLIRTVCFTLRRDMKQCRANLHQSHRPKPDLLRMRAPRRACLCHAIGLESRHIRRCLSQLGVAPIGRGSWRASRGPGAPVPPGLQPRHRGLADRTGWRAPSAATREALARRALRRRLPGASASHAEKASIWASSRSSRVALADSQSPTPSGASGTNRCLARIACC